MNESLQVSVEKLQEVHGATLTPDEAPS